MCSIKFDFCCEQLTDWNFNLTMVFKGVASNSSTWNTEAGRSL